MENELRLCAPCRNTLTESYELKDISDKTEHEKCQLCRLKTYTRIYSIKPKRKDRG